MDFRLHWKICIIFYLCFSCSGTPHSHHSRTHHGKRIGNVCTLSNGDRGKCLELSCCQSARNLILKGLEPEICTVRRSVPIVCCSNGSKFDEGVGDKESLKSYQKCREYSNLPFFSWTNTTSCGFSTQPIIIGGIPAKLKEFPHLAALGYIDEEGEKRWYCGGSLISENFILTSAHCCKSRKMPEFVRLSLFNLSNPDETDSLQELKVKEVFLHPDYHSNGTKYHDIALLKLEHDVNFNPYVRPVCLNLEQSITSDAGLVAGWGDDGFVQQTEGLLGAKLHFINPDVCEQYYNKDTSKIYLPSGIDHKTQFCAGRFQDNKRIDTCKGDSGGPLLVYRQDAQCMYDIVGITSWCLHKSATLCVLDRECSLEIGTTFGNQLFYLSVLASNPLSFK